MKVKAPLLSLEASGKIGERLVFSKRASGQQARFQKAQKDFYTQKRADNRDLYNFARITWNNFSDSQKLNYNNEARFKNMTGYNLFMQKALENPKKYIGLSTYLTFNKIATNPISDISKNGNNGYLLPSYPSNCPVFVDSKNIKTFKALSFDGVNDYVNCGTSQENLSTSACSVSFLIKSNPLVNQVIFADGKSKISFGFFFDYGSRSAIVSCGSFFDSLPIFPLLNWDSQKFNHIIITYNSSHIPSFYLNGVSIRSEIATQWWTHTLSNLYLGCRYTVINDRFFDGFIDEFCIFNRQLSEKEVKDIYKLYN